MTRFNPELPIHQRISRGYVDTAISEKNSEEIIQAGAQYLAERTGGLLFLAIKQAGWPEDLKAELTEKDQFLLKGLSIGAYISRVSMGFFLHQHIDLIEALLEVELALLAKRVSTSGTSPTNTLEHGEPFVLELERHTGLSVIPSNLEKLDRSNNRAYVRCGIGAFAIALIQAAENAEDPQPGLHSDLASLMNKKALDIKVPYH